MKNIKSLVTMFLILLVTIAHAQKIQYGGKEYNVKKDRIFFETIDVTDSLTNNQVLAIKARLQEKLAVERKIKDAEKAQKKAEKKVKKAEKAQKKAERELKWRLDAERELKKNKERYAKELKKYEKLKKREKLSLEDEAKWQKKLNALKLKIEKSKKKLNRY